MVTHAYEVLSDPVSRENYDRGGDSNPFGGGGFADFGDIFSTFFGGGQSSRGPRSRSERGQDALLRLDVELADVIFGIEKEVEFDTAAVCETCSGSCCQPGTSPVTCDICGGAGVINRTVRSLLGNVMTQAPCGSCRGFGTVIATPCTTCQGHGRVRARKTVTIDVPAGVDSGVRLHLPGSGEVGPAGGASGDLFIEILVRSNDVFNRLKDDLLCTVDVSMADAILGTTFTFEALDGPVDVEIKPGAQSADVIVIRDRGIGRLRGNGRGDLRIGLHVLTPTKLSAKEKELIASFASSRKAQPPVLGSFQQGLFAKLRDRFL
ncbi:unannotated protein [freshwater metagenome]|uniref:Unannotated protein n=1 Tax=freshwater metagenome TaxID=449393 RepID=A0A6J7FN73_9ZZZZ